MQLVHINESNALDKKLLPSVAIYVTPAYPYLPDIQSTMKRQAAYPTNGGVPIFTRNNLVPQFKRIYATLPIRSRHQCISYETMRLVHSKDANRYAFDSPVEVGVLEPLWRHIENLVLSSGHGFERLPLLLGRHGRIYLADRQAESLELVDLVLHQGDERTDHDGHTVDHESGKLKSEALAKARGHDHEGAIDPLDDLVYYRLLPRTEGFEPEGLESLRLVHSGPGGDGQGFCYRGRRLLQLPAAPLTGGPHFFEHSHCPILHGRDAGFQIQLMVAGPLYAWSQTNQAKHIMVELLLSIPSL